MQMPGRVFSSGSYRYGFNGKENDNDVKGAGNQQDYGMRIYDPRLGRFLSVDPITKEYAELSPYQSSSNNPVLNIDIDGLEGLKGAMAKGIEFYPFALYKNSIPLTTYSRSGKGQTIDVGSYLLTPHYATVKGKEVLKYYLASNVEKDYRNDYIIEPNALASFISSEKSDGFGRDTYTEVADDLHATLNDFKVYGDAFLKKFMEYLETGNGGLSLQLETTAEDWKNPVYLVAVASGFVAAGESAVANSEFKRPPGATNTAQRKSVQNNPCVSCGVLSPKNIADHKLALVKEFRRKGKIDLKRMKSIEAVQPQCPTCSSAQGGEMKKWSAKEKAKTKIGTPGVSPKKKQK